MGSKQRIPQRLRDQVRARAGGRCEYCQLPEQFTVLRFEADHIIAEKHGGQTAVGNLAWACPDCNRYKGADVGSYDLISEQFVPFYHPRRDVWEEHFRLDGALIQALTANGRVTERLLRFNDEDRVRIRVGLVALGYYQ